MSPERYANGLRLLRRVVLGLLVAVAVLCALVAVSFKSLNDRADDIAETQDRLEQQDRRISRMALGNCTTIAEQTDALYGLLKILQAMVDNGALGPDAEVRLEEPERHKCDGDVIPGPDRPQP